MPNPSNDYGRAAIDPQQAVAGGYGMWRLTYQAGAKGVAVGGSIRVYTDSDTDWAPPQLLDAAGADYMTLEAAPGVNVSAKVESQRSFRLFIRGRALQSGELIVVVLGDTRGGGPGSRAQTFVESPRFFWFDVDTQGDGQYETLPDPPCIRVVGDQISRLVVIAPSTVVVGQPFRLLVKAEDRWGNPTAGYNGQITLAGDGVEIDPGSQTVNFADNSAGAQWLEGLVAVRPGLLSISADDEELGIGGASNPILASETSQPKLLHDYQLAWADPHGGQLVLHSKIGDFFRYARDVAGVQFVGYQRNADAISEEDWRVQQQEERDHYQPGHFTPIPGFEWSGRTWQGGHHNIYFRRHGQDARRNEAVEEMFQADRAKTELAHILDVYRAYRNQDVIITPHVGGEHSDLTHHEPTLEPAVEIVSSHGMFEWMLHDALRRNYRLGFLGGSDSYTGRPGDDRPGYQTRRYSKAGLTGIYVNDISLESFHEAMRARRVYATTGVRMILHSEADGHLMGSQYSTDKPPTIRGYIVGAGPLESVELFRDQQRIYSAPLETSLNPDQVRILWQGASRRTSYSGVVWVGVASVEGGRITGVETIRFDSPRSQIIEQTDNTIRWQAWGCGYPMGLVVSVKDTQNTVLELSFSTQTITGPSYGDHGSRPPRRISFAPAESGTMRVALSDLLKSGAEVLELGVIDRKVRVELAPVSTTSTAEFRFTDPAPSAGINPYWIRVVQQNMEMGWTSPIFVDFFGVLD